MSLEDMKRADDARDAKMLEGFARPLEKAAIKADGGGLRYNEGKNRLELLPTEWNWALGLVMTRGAIKYATRNWERGMAWSTMVGCTLRHVFKFVAGERYDPESGCHHLAHAAWNCLGLMSYDLRGIGENDLVRDMEILDKVAQEPGPALLEYMRKKAEQK